MIHVGTSGYNYPEWKGRFYPEKIAAKAMLPYYAGVFDTVEINYTFYRMPTAALVEGWAAQVPEAFTFTLKAPKRITHDRRLQDVTDPLRAFCAAGAAARSAPRLRARAAEPELQVRRATAAGLHRRTAAGPARGLRVPPPVVVDRRDLRDARRRATSRCASPTAPIATRRSCAPRTTATCACATKATPRPTSSAGRGYVTEQQDAWRDTFVYFKHEDEGKGPEFASLFRARLGRSSTGCRIAECRRTSRHSARPHPRPTCGRMCSAHLTMACSAQ